MIGYFVILLLVPLIASIIIVGPRSKIVILRPFGDTNLSNSLSAFIITNLAGRGYIYTLSDKTFGVNKVVVLFYIVSLLLQIGYNSISFLISPFVRDVTSIGVITDEYSYSGFVEAIENWPTKSHMYYNAYSGGQAFTISSSNEWWTFCINAMILRSDIIIIDLSMVKQGTEHELTVISKFELQNKCILLSLISTEDHARNIISSYFEDDNQSHLHLFHEGGTLVEPERFHIEFVRILNRTLIQKNA